MRVTRAVVHRAHLHLAGIFSGPHAKESARTAIRFCSGYAHGVIASWRECRSLYAAKETGKAPQRVSGAHLCEALNRPDLAELLGTPGETAKTAGGSGGPSSLPAARR